MKIPFDEGIYFLEVSLEETETPYWTYSRPTNVVLIADVQVLGRTWQNRPVQFFRHTLIPRLQIALSSLLSLLCSLLGAAICLMTCAIVALDG